MSETTIGVLRRAITGEVPPVVRLLAQIADREAARRQALTQPARNGPLPARSQHVARHEGREVRFHA